MPPTVVCPTCCQALPAGAQGQGAAALELAADLRLGGQQRLIFLHLAEAGRRGSSITKIIDALYVDDPEGGALTAKDGVRVVVHHLRRRLAITSWRVETILGFGYRLVTPTQETS